MTVYLSTPLCMQLPNLYMANVPSSNKASSNNRKHPQILRSLLNNRPLIPAYVQNKEIVVDNKFPTIYNNIGPDPKSMETIGNNNIPKEFQISQHNKDKQSEPYRVIFDWYLFACFHTCPFLVWPSIADTSTLFPSFPEHLKEKLEEYMARFTKVRIVRTKKREGLIRTRLLGASMAKGEVLTFLDSHCEVNVNWLPPLLNQIALNRKTIVCPMIDVIDHNHFGYEAQAGDAMRGAFDWEMYYKRIPIPPELQRSDPSDPFESPVMAGGLFAVDREWFWELGGYDPGLEIWGGEQYEISFKVWMCGGGMFDVPCSRVGHIYRKYVPYKVPSGTSLARNLKRVAETWMDEFAEYVYQRRPEYRHLSTGDISAQKELRKHLKCKDFKWFMAAVAWDVPKYYPPVEPPPAAWGEIRNVAANLCVDSKHGATGTELRLDVCVKDGSERTWSHEQLFTFGWREDIRPGEPLHTRKFCFDAVSHSSPVTLYDCHGMKGNQHWSYRKDKTLFHPVSNSCIDCNPAEKKIFMNRCDPLSETQQWIFEHINMTVLEKFNSKASS
uniref:Polypeptide N-acetylgalactosaminyltransferase n=1 Tax=Chrysemys picta bellii TaxID=8478 RepID=A0A8C3F6L8_CHRPI